MPAKKAQDCRTRASYIRQLLASGRIINLSFSLGFYGNFRAEINRNLLEKT